jgi:hypothetical protein
LTEGQRFEHRTSLLDRRQIEDEYYSIAILKGVPLVDLARQIKTDGIGASLDESSLTISGERGTLSLPMARILVVVTDGGRKGRAFGPHRSESINFCSSSLPNLCSEPSHNPNGS